MIFQIPDAIRDVKVAIDHNASGQQLLIEDDVDTLLTDEIVRSKLIEATRQVLSIAPPHLLDGGTQFGDAVYWRDGSAGWIILPEDFMRLFIFKMSDWERPVYIPITAADPNYQLQFSRCKGIRGTPQKPVVAIVSRSEGLSLEFFSCKNTNATVEQALYLPFPKIDDYGGIDIPERCYNAVIYDAASLSLTTLGEIDLSAKMAEICKDFLI